MAAEPDVRYCVWYVDWVGKDFRREGCGVSRLVTECGGDAWGDEWCDFRYSGLPVEGLVVEFVVRNKGLLYLERLRCCENYVGLPSST